MKTKNTLAVFLAVASLVGPVNAAPGDSADVLFVTVDGQPAGRAVIKEGADGLAIVGRVGDQIPRGLHGIHIHEVGTCEPPFDSAGGHYNPHGREHGHHNANGPHAGDLSNIDVGATGEFELVAVGLTLDQIETGLMDADGASIIIHAGADDEASDPSGNSGARLLCGVIERNP